MKQAVKSVLCTALAMALALPGIGLTKHEVMAAKPAEPTAITLYKPLYASLQQYIKGNEELPFWKEYEKRTNTKITFMTPPVGQEKEQFNLILASGKYPDIFVYDWIGYPGGPAKAVNDKIIIPLDDLIKKNAPNIQKEFERFPTAVKYVSTQSGQIFAAPLIYDVPSQQVAWGPNARLDWLKDLKMEIPETIDEWYAMLKAFKEKKGAASPLVYTVAHYKDSDCFTGAYNVSTKFHQVDGVVKYGPSEPGYKEYLTLLRKWYSEGLIDQDFASMDDKTRNTKILNGQAGIAYAPTKSGLAAWTAELRKTNANATMGGIPYPSLKKGEKVNVGKANDKAKSAAAISSTAKNTQKCMEFIDYAFGEEGHKLISFGLEGESYTMVNNKPTYTDKIMNAKEMAPIAMLGKFTMAAEGGVWGVTEVGFVQQMNAYDPEINIALDRWSSSNTFSQNIPLAVTPSSADSSKYSTIMNEVTTYVDEMFLKFVMGQEPLDKFDAFVKNLQNKKIDDAVAIMQKSYDAFSSKK